MARNTAFTYNGKPIDVKQIGRELNVRYVLVGGVQRFGNRLRVNVQLIDAETGAHRWAERGLLVPTYRGASLAALAAMGIAVRTLSRSNEIADQTRQQQL